MIGENIEGSPPLCWFPSSLAVKALRKKLQEGPRDSFMSRKTGEEVGSPVPFLEGHSRGATMLIGTRGGGRKAGGLSLLL